MNWIFVFFISVLGIGLLFSVLALMVERLLVTNGIIRKNTAWLVIACFFTAFCRQLYPDIHVSWLLGVFIVVFGPIILNRSDVYDTFKKGRWWWKNENNTKKH
jgi:hypothetical protein